MDDDLTFTPPRPAPVARRYALRAPSPRPLVRIEHSLGQFCTFGDGLLELFEVVSTLSGEWTFEYEWKPCLTSG